MREINPKDVPQLIRDGKLEFGMELEVSCVDSLWVKREWIGMDKDNFVARSGGDQTQSYYSWPCARFPLSALRDGDPVVVGESHRHFCEFREDGIMVYQAGKTRWTYEGEGTFAINYDWRLPTKQELSESGYSEEQIAEMMTRWGGK